MRKLKKKVIVMLALVVVVAGVAVYFLTRPAIVFNDDVQIEINSEYDAVSFIEKVRGHDISEVKADTGKIDVTKLGNYTITYSLGDETYELEVEVVDTKAPDFDVKKDMVTDASGQLKASELVENIKDETKTKAYFKEDYDLKETGQHDITVVVEDEGGNKTEKKTKVKIVDDHEAPTLTGVQDLVVLQNKEIDYLKNVKAQDNYDPDPKIKVDDSQVQLSKLGDYKMTYTVSDRSGNKTKYEQTVSVVDKLPIKDKGQSEEKIVYLTFDDGPSANTLKILDILDQYDAKATFFVTGTNQKYNYVIKEAHKRGHTIGLHTYSHDYASLYKSVDAYFDDLNKVGEMVKKEIGYVPRFIRFPGGASNTISRKYCPGIMSTLVNEVKARGYQYYDWNADSTDASGNHVAVSKLVANGTSSQATNINLLCHDTDAKSTTVEALPAIISHYKQLGYQFKGIDEDSFTPHQKVNN